MSAETLMSPSGKKLHYVTTRMTTPLNDDAAKELKVKKRRAERLAENIEYLKNKNVQAYLTTISMAEGGDYDLKYGGVIGKKKDKWRITDFSTHPGPGVDGKTTASGRYQINRANWQENGIKKMGLSDFSSGTQDLIAVESIRQVNAIEDVISGDIAEASRKTSSVWAAIPKGPDLPNAAGQPYMRYDKFLKAYRQWRDCQMTRATILCAVLLATLGFNSTIFASNTSPVEQGMSFTDARTVLMQQRWKPSKIVRDTEPFAVEKMLLRHGVAEVESCTVDSFCIFRYKKGKQCLRLVARGESLTDLTVLHWDYQCP